MAVGKRKRQHQDTFWVAADKLGGGPRNAFYDRLNRLLDEIDFDGQLEKAAEPYYESTGRKGLPPGVYFRMIFNNRKPRKKVSNDEWESATDLDSRIAQMKDGHYHLKYKAENAVDLETEVIVTASTALAAVVSTYFLRFFAFSRRVAVFQ